MPTRISLLRSVNVLGKNVIRMPDLARAFEKTGFMNVRTYIQSGNIIFETAEESCEIVTAKIRDLIAKKFGLAIHVLVITPQELTEIVSNNPFTGRAGIDFNRLHVTFLDREADPEKVKKLLSYNYPPDEIIIGHRAVYVHCPEGYGHTKYDNNFIEKKLAANATSRNWNTCLKLMEMSGENRMKKPVTKISGVRLNAPDGARVTPVMPVLFVGHGSPMNAIEDNEFSAGWREIGARLPRPSAILCISAHWQTRGTMVTAMEKPETIHDFGGFPRELYDVQYPAPGSPALAASVMETAGDSVIEPDQRWGLDHGAWSVIRRMYPEADVPVVEMSLDYAITPQQHYDLARQLAPLRRKGVMIIGSGNMVHNLGLVSWEHMNTPGFAFDWAADAGERMKKFILGGDHAPLIGYDKQGRAFRLAIPTPEHFLPLLYALALRERDEPVELFNDKPVAGSLTMTSVRIG